MQREYKISVIIPAYNVEDYVERAVKNLIEQTIADKIEIVLVDDGSVDRTPNICDELSNAYENINVIHQKNAGVSAARNKGIEHASGKYIAFMDADDYVEKQMYEILLRNIEKYDADISCVGYAIQRRNGMRVERYNTKNLYVWDRKTALYEMLSEQKFDFLCIDKLYKRENILNNLFDTTVAIGEDRQFVFENIVKCNKLVFEDICCYIYERRDGSAMDKIFSEKNVVNYNVAKKMCEYVLEHFEEVKLQKVAKCHLVRSAYKTLEKLDMSNEGKNTYKELRRDLYKIVREFRLRDANGILSNRHTFAIFLMKYCPWAYITLCKILDV